MQVRLGFGVITTLDEPIILVDEVLAVGDKAFREKCYERMEGLLAQGRTLFLVSHSEGDLSRFCTRGIYLRGGEMVVDAPLGEAMGSTTRTWGCVPTLREKPITRSRAECAPLRSGARKPTGASKP